MGKMKSSEIHPLLLGLVVRVKNVCCSHQNMSFEVMTMYVEGEVKLRKTLKDVSLEDHEWDLKSYNCHDKAIVVLYCRE